jgi:hypothetical protein
VIQGSAPSAIGFLKTQVAGGAVVPFTAAFEHAARKTSVIDWANLVSFIGKEGSGKVRGGPRA